MQRKNKYLLTGLAAVSAIVGGLITEGIRRVSPPSSDISVVLQDRETGRIRITLESQGLFGPSYNRFGASKRSFEYKPSFEGLDSCVANPLKERNLQNYVNANEGFSR
jgi:hypothetical protein